jgi:UDP:flavonoid glycosyltransferase YjiC (YdhE family)
MKRLTILALGSRGDVQPYVALGRALHEAGYRVRIVTYESFHSMVAAQGLDFHPVPGDAQALTQLAARSGLNHTRNPFVLMRAIMHSFGSIIEDYITTFSAEVLHDSDAILNQLPAGLFGRDLAEKLRVPHIALSVIPLMRTAAFPSVLLGTRSHGAWGNRLSYDFSANLVWIMFRSAISRFRARLGLGRASLLFPGFDRPLINGFSPRVVPPPADWGAGVYTVGYWVLDESGWESSAELLRFLEAGAPPVFIGFGSMIAPDAEGMTRTLLQAVQQTGVRAVLGHGWAGIGEGHLPDTVYRLDYAPYRWLFPRMAAVVHHGGSGTTGLALASGVPSMVVAFTADQPYWGQRTAALGAGLPPLSAQHLAAEPLAAALHTLTTDPQLRQRAAHLGTQLQQEDGLAAAVALIRGWV